MLHFLTRTGALTVSSITFTSMKWRMPVIFIGGSPCLRSTPSFTIALEIQVSSLGDTPYGSRRIFYFDAGSFDGPKLKGTVLPGGGGSSRIRRDDALEVDVQLILETDDKHQIYMAWKDFAMVRRRSWTAFIAARSSTREPTISAPRLTSRRVQKSTAG